MTTMYEMKTNEDLINAEPVTIDHINKMINHVNKLIALSGMNGIDIDHINKMVDHVNKLIALSGADGVDIDSISDGYHTFGELYDHREVLLALAVNSLSMIDKTCCWKSLNHHDPDFPMYDGMFIVGIETPQGQATYHCHTKNWELFACKELEYAPEFDGHTPNDVLTRLRATAELLSVNM